MGKAGANKGWIIQQVTTVRDWDSALLDRPAIVWNRRPMGLGYLSTESYQLLVDSCSQEVINCRAGPVRPQVRGW